MLLFDVKSGLEETKIFCCFDPMVERRAFVFDLEGFFESKNLPIVSFPDDLRVVTHGVCLQQHLVYRFCIALEQSFYVAPAMTLIEMLEIQRCPFASMHVVWCG